MPKQLSVEADDANIEVGDVEVDSGALVAPADRYVRELRAVPKRDLARATLSVRTLKCVFATGEPGRAFSRASNAERGVARSLARCGRCSL